jgi:hypothetical protein
LDSDDLGALRGDFDHIEVRRFILNGATRARSSAVNKDGLLSYFRHQTDTGLPRDRSDFCRSPSLPLQCVIVIDWHASMTGTGDIQKHPDDMIARR